LMLNEKYINTAAIKQHRSMETRADNIYRHINQTVKFICTGKVKIEIFVTTLT